jgi:hypothetical protein
MNDGSAAPHSVRPRPIVWLNRTVESLRRLGVFNGPLHADELIRAARSRTGLTDFGDERFREPLSVLVDSIEREADLHATGRLITKTRLIGALCTRLRVAEHLREQPDVLTRSLPAPIVIAGLQRTGTTMLHRLLASDRRLRALLSWEAIAPLPPRGSVLGMDPRVLQAKLSERALAFMAPEFFAIHPVEAGAPEEDVLLLDYSFLSTVPEATLHVPSYAAWLERQDNRPAYEYLATLLKIMTAAAGPTRWVLKTPHHLEYLDVLRSVLPGSTIIQTHRDPLQTLASFCSMVFHGRRVFSDRVDAREVGRHWSRKVGRLLDRAVTVRERVRDEGFVDVQYEDLVRDPIAVIRTLYPALGLSLDEETLHRMEATRSQNPQHKYGKHRYRLEDFGLDEANVAPFLTRYRAYFASGQ